MNRVLILAGSGSCGRAAGAIPHGSEIASGNTLSRSSWSSCNNCDRRSPRISTGMASAPPTVAIGTIGTPARIAIFTKPLRPARLARSRSAHGRSESTSPPAITRRRGPRPAPSRSRPARPAAPPSTRKYRPIPGMAISASCAVPCNGRSWPNRRHHCRPTVHASQTNGAPEWMPTNSTGDCRERSPSRRSPCETNSPPTHSRRTSAAAWWPRPGPRGPSRRHVGHPAAHSAVLFARVSSASPRAHRGRIAALGRRTSLGR